MVITSNFVYRIWVGSSIHVSLPLTIIMAVYVILNAWNNIYSHFLNGVGFIKLQLFGGVIGALLNVPFAIFLGKHFGIGGVILSTVILGLPGFLLLPIQYNKIISGTASGIWGK